MRQGWELAVGAAFAVVTVVVLAGALIVGAVVDLVRWLAG